LAVAHLNGTDLFYVEVGEGVPCLVMHGGLGGDHTCLHPWLDPLGGVMYLVYYDHRGYGRSGRPPSETITFERLCADADALREHLGGGRRGE
jgi:proline iminopeptidase